MRTVILLTVTGALIAMMLYSAIAAERNWSTPCFDNTDKWYTRRVDNE